MNYENRVYNYSDKLPIKDRNYSYYMINNKERRDYNHNFSNSCNSYNNNDNNLISSNMRMNNIESRLISYNLTILKKYIKFNLNLIKLNTMEKMMKYFDEFIHLKEEEKLNNLTSLEISSDIHSYLNDLITKINKLEKEIDNLKKQKQKSEIENSKTIENLKNKINFLEEIINNKKINLENNENNLINNTNIENEKKINLNLLLEQNNKEKFNKNGEMEEFIQNKLNEIYSNNKISEMLYLIEDINKIAEDNEFNINEQNENIRKIQNDNLTLIKIVAVHSEKINNIDYILNELNNLKNKYFQIASVVNNVNNEKEEEIFTNEFIAKYKVDDNEKKNENENENGNENENN